MLEMASRNLEGYREEVRLANDEYCTCGSITPPKLHAPPHRPYRPRRSTASTMTSTTSYPETYYISYPTPHVPNSALPVLIYRSVLPTNPIPESICSRIQPNKWLKGGVFKHYPAHHFHSVTHECYAVFKGHSRLLLGRGPLDPETEEDVLVELKMGDAIVLPAGVAHCSTYSDYVSMALWA